MVTDKLYREFIDRKSQLGSMGGFEPLFLPEWLFDFQQSLVTWAIRKGRAAIFADCGLGKTPMQLVWAENVVRKTNKPVLILTPLAVSHQTAREADKFGIDCQRSGDGKFTSKIVATNYQRLHHFNASDFGGVVLDESSILKNFAGKTRQQVTEFMRMIDYRLLCTATAAPNDYVELGTSSEALGDLGHSDMITRFFKEEVSKDYLGWGRKTYQFRGHSEFHFWKWVCSWARACRKPSDLGFDDQAMKLPPLVERELVLETSTARSGFLFPVIARDMQEQREERRITVKERCNEVGRIIAESDGTPHAIWCHLNEEGNMLAKVLANAVQVKGSMSDEEKEEKLLAFQSGQVKNLIIKPKIGCFGLNWQHCHNVITFPSHSFEQYYQLVRRCLRFGQVNPVVVTTVATEGERGILANAQRKADQCAEMFESLVKHMAGAMKIEDQWKFPNREKLPAWL